MASNEISRRASSTANYERTATTDESGGNDTDAGVRTIDIEGSSSLDRSRYRLLVPVPGGEELEAFESIVRTAATIARDREGDLLVLCLVDVPRQTPYEALTPDLPRVERAHETAERLLGVVRETGVRTSTIVGLTHRGGRSIVDVADRHGCDGVFMPVEADRSQRRRLLGGATVERIVSHAETDVFVEKTGPRETPTERVLLAVSGGPHSGLAAETARALALTSGAHVDVVHVLDESVTDDERKDGTVILRAAERLLDDVGRVDTHLVTGGDVAAAIVSRSDMYDITVLGASMAGLLEQFVFGTVPDSVTRRTENAVLMTKHRIDDSSMYHRWIAGDTEGNRNR